MNCFLDKVYLINSNTGGTSKSSDPRKGGKSLFLTFKDLFAKKLDQVRSLQHRRTSILLSTNNEVELIKINSQIKELMQQMETIASRMTSECKKAEERLDLGKSEFGEGVLEVIDRLKRLEEQQGTDIQMKIGKEHKEPDSKMNQIELNLETDHKGLLDQSLDLEEKQAILRWKAYDCELDSEINELEREVDAVLENLEGIRVNLDENKDQLNSITDDLQELGFNLETTNARLKLITLKFKSEGSLISEVIMSALFALTLGVFCYLLKKYINLK